MIPVFCATLSFFGPSIRLSSGAEHKIVGKGPPVVLSSGLYGTMPSFMYNSFVDTLKKNMTVILPSGKPILTDTIDEIAEQLNVNRMAFISHSSFDYTILNNPRIHRAVCLDPVSIPRVELSPLVYSDRTIQPSVDTMVFESSLSQTMNEVPFIPKGFNLNIETDRNIPCNNVGHADILDDFWADTAERMGIKGMMSTQIGAPQTFESWKYEKNDANAQKSRRDYRQKVASKIVDFFVKNDRIIVL